MKSTTIKLVSIAFSIFCGSALFAQTNNIAINPSAAPPAASAVLDVNSDAATAPKGMLIPRMTQAQRLLIAGGTPTNGMTVFQTNTTAQGPLGFWVYLNAGSGWVPMIAGDDAWQLTGNTGTIPVSNYLGTTDNQPIIFRTNNTVRGQVSSTGEFIVGSPPSGSSEKLQVDGAIRMIGAAATNDAGVIQWDATSMRHQGNVDGTPTGWIAMENPYKEEFQANYTQVITATCANGAAEIPTSSTALLSTNGNMTPFKIGDARHRSQYLFRRNELDLGLAQLNNPSQTEGLCAGQPINSIAIYIDSWAGAGNFITLLKVSMMHSQFTAFTPTGPFDDNFTNASCVCFAPSGCANGVKVMPTASTTGWQTFTFDTPFVWNGIDNIVIDFCYSAGGVPPATARVAVVTGLTYNASKAHFGPASNASCIGTGSCGGGAFPIAGCGMNPSGCTGGGAVNIRPIFRFNGIIATAPAPATAQDNYILYEGGIGIEKDPGWATSPGPPIPTFKGPGTISAQEGVYSNLSQLNDHIFDLYFDGRVSAEEANLFGDRRHMDVDEMTSFIAEKRHLPTMKGRIDWVRNGGFSLDDLTDQLWMTAETQALYLSEMNEQVDVLEMLSTERPLSEAEFEMLKKGVAAMTDLTDGKKEQLIDMCAGRVASTSKK